MQEGCAADGSDLAVAEKAGHRYVAEVFSEDVGVEVGTPLEPSPRPRQEKRRDPETDLGRVFSQRGSMVGRSSAEVSRRGGGSGGASPPADSLRRLWHRGGGPRR